MGCGKNGRPGETATQHAETETGGASVHAFPPSMAAWTAMARQIVASRVLLTVLVRKASVNHFILYCHPFCI